MSRRQRAETRETPADPKYGSQEVTRFINVLMVDGKKSVADGIFYDAMRKIEEKAGQPGWLPAVLWVPMQMGSLFGPALASFGAWWRWGVWRAWVGALAVPVVGWQLAKVIKEQIERSRPFEAFEDLEVKAGTPTEGLGFLSGHATVAFAIAAVLSPYLNRTQRAVGYLLAAIVAIARVDVGAHLPLDVIGGAAFGYALGLIWHLAVGRPATPLERN